MQNFLVRSDGVWWIKNHKKAQDLELRNNPNAPLPAEAWLVCEQITTRYFDIKALGVTPDRKSRYHQVQAVNQEGYLITKWIASGKIASASQITELASQGFPVNSENARKIVQFIAERENAGFPLVIMVPQTGWVTLDQDTGVGGWLVGTNWIGPEGYLVAPVPDLQNNALFKGLRLAGKVEKWQEGFEQFFARSNPVCRFQLAAAFLPPLLRILKVRGFIVHHWCESGGGKSALATWLISIWGNAKPDWGDTFALSFNGTILGIQNSIMEASQLPISLNELQSSGFKGDKDQVYRLIYQLVEGKARIRCNSDGTNQNQKVPNSVGVFFSNGEEGLLKSDSVQAGGAAKRMLQIHGPAFSEEEAEDAHQWLENNQCYGVAGQAFLEWLLPIVNDPAGRTELLTRLEETTQTIRDSGLAKGQRATYLGAVALSYALVCRCFQDVGLTQGLPAAIADALDIAKHADDHTASVGGSEAQGFIDMLSDLTVSRPRQWVDPKEEPNRWAAKDWDSLLGVINPPEKIFKGEAKVWLVVSNLQQWLKHQGLDLDRLVNELRLRGYLLKHPNTKGSERRTISGRQTRVVILNHWPSAKKD